MLSLLVLAQVWMGCRTLRLRAVRDGLRRFPQQLRQRKAIQARRCLPLGEICRLLVWDPRLVSRLAIVSLARRKPQPHVGK